MKHAGPEALDTLEPVLAELRSVPGLVERSRGVFYKKAKAFVHFHEDPSGMHGDVRVGEEFERHRVETVAEREAFLGLVRSIATEARTD